MKGQFLQLKYQFKQQQMIITKHLEEEIKQFLDNYWKVYLEGDMHTWSTYLTDDYKNIGTTEEEIWNSKKDIMDYTNAITDQMVGVAELRNKKTEVFSLTPYVLAHEFADMYIKIENAWVFYGKFRLSSILQRSEAGWQVVHQHGSYPDSKTEQGEAFAFDKISSENRELKDAIKRRTVELENKTRELEIEAALERVRTAAMAMKEPIDMVEVCRILSDQLQTLGVNDIRNVQTVIINESKGTYLNYQYFTTYAKGIVEDTEYNKHPKVFEMVQAMRSSADAFFGGSMEEEELQTFREWRKVNNQFPDPLLDEATAIHYSFYSIGLGGLGLTTYKPLPHAGLEIFKRFHNVFTLAYRRFIDIELALAQTREAKIEAALERTRTQSMLMQHSNELDITSRVFHQQLLLLGIESDISFVWLPDVEKEKHLFWTTWAEMENDSTELQSKSVIYDLDRTEPYTAECFRAWESGEPVHIYTVAPVEVKSYFDTWGELFGDAKKLKPGLYPQGLYYAEAFMKYGCFGFLIGRLLTEDEKKILLRFTIEFERTYTRFLDLQKAEAQARESQIEAALEKIRSSALTMQTSQQLKDVASELRNQMRLLGQEDLEVCAINLYDVDENYFESWGAIRTRDGNEKLFEGNARFPKSGVKIVDEMMQHYNMGTRDYVLVNEKEKAKEWITVLKEYSPEVFEMIRETIAIQKTEDLRVYWSLADFDGGAMLMVTYSEPDDSSRDMLRRTANVFELAYRRFQDLQTAEAHTEKAKLDLIQIQTEKKRAEEALAELQATQKQLIHAEKMASLGELTAGIAHEIQNPLNFVNNFSEVSVDIVNDLNEEMEKGNLEEVKAIVGDLKQNLEKISHHGKRASGIVKGMLEHSRTHTGQKEPTDINALADEYLRLAYHGLRAKDKSFNADFKTELDKSLPKIKVIPQDIGRVMLNLINNAFYAVSERAKQNEKGYRPEVSVITKNLVDKIEIRVKDNGNGIPESVRDKIFQPFFTTKPAGLGTGLGLSMSYDIITKGHGGEINLTSNQKGTIFNIILKK
jgi:signal transduction histidine kinase